MTDIENASLTLYEMLLLFFAAYTAWHEAPSDETFAPVDELFRNISEAQTKASIEMMDPKTQTETATFTHPQDILICEEHQLTQHFEKGQTWGDVGSVITDHRRTVHLEDTEGTV